MKVLVTGAKGQVGSALARLSHPGLTVHALSRAKLDITDADAIARVFDDVQPDAVVNPAAYPAVDKAESEPERADRVNRLAPGLLAKACARAQIPLVHLSTDFVFDGEKGAPYVEDDPVSPRGRMRRRKRAGRTPFATRHRTTSYSAWPGCSVPTPDFRPRCSSCSARARRYPW